MKNVIEQITEYAVENSKNIMGQDMNLIGVATVIRDINDSIIAAFATENTNDKKNKLEGLLTSTRTKLSEQSKNIERTYMTPSKKNAQQVLQKTINFLITTVMPVIAQEWELLDSNTFK